MWSKPGNSCSQFILPTSGFHFWIHSDLLQIILESKRIFVPKFKSSISSLWYANEYGKAGWKDRQHENIMPQVTEYWSWMYTHFVSREIHQLLKTVPGGHPAAKIYRILSIHVTSEWSLVCTQSHVLQSNSRDKWKLCSFSQPIGSETLWAEQSIENITIMFYQVLKQAWLIYPTSLLRTPWHFSE